MTSIATIPDVAETTQFTAKLAHLVRSWPGTQRALADKVGVTPQMMSEYLRGAIPKPSVIHRLAIELGVIDNLPWLLDEDDDRLEPVEDLIEPRLSRATLSQFIQDGGRRYRQAAVYFEQLLSIELESEYPWTRAATLILFPHDPENHPQSESLEKVFMRFELIDRLAHQVDQLSHFHEPHWGPHMYPLRREADDTDQVELGVFAPDELMRKFRLFREKRPGYDAICMYQMARMLTHTQIKPRLHFFWYALAPVYLARIVLDDSSKDWEDREEVRKDLKKWGFIHGKKGREVAAELPKSWQWPSVSKHAGDEHLTPWDKFFAKPRDWRELGPLPENISIFDDIEGALRKRKK